MGKLCIKAIMIGALVDVGITFLVGIPFTLYVISTLNTSQLSQNQVNSLATATIDSVITFHLAKVAILMLATLMGGFAAGLVAKQLRATNGAVSTLPSIVVSIAFLAVKPFTPRVLESLLLLGISPIVGFIGGYAAMCSRNPTSN